MASTGINLHKVIGATLVAAWLNLMLYVLVIDRTFHYFHHYHTDKFLFKIAVLTALACNTATAIANCADTYFNAVTFQGNILGLQTRQWPRSLHLASTGICAAIVQVFMLYRYWLLTQRKVVIIAIGLVILFSFASTLYSTILFCIFFEPRTQVLRGVIMSLSSAMAADMSIALLLVLYYLSTDHDSMLKSSRRLVRRLVTLALKTGSFPALTAMLSLIVFATDVQSNVTSVFIGCIGCIYSLTLLYNLNIRRKLITSSLNVRSSCIPDLNSHDSHVASNLQSKNVRRIGIQDRGQARRDSERLAAKHLDLGLYATGIIDGTS